MELTNSKGGGPDRRVSTRSSIRISTDYGSDDFGAGAIADGFRPTPSRLVDDNDGTRLAAASSPSINTLVTDESLPSSPPSAPSTPSSAPKAHIPHESFALRHDGAMGPINESSMSARTRSSSISTDSVPFIHTESPYQGPDGPSHPYQMYPQNVRLARTMSTTTSSTEAVSESTYAGPRGPAHPYGMYTQTIAAESGDVPRVAPVPVFNGLPDQYQRRMGPEGEDVADMIGPDGHTEQLPPYTRYPDETYARKVRDAEDSDGPLPVPLTGGATVVRTNASPMSREAIPGAGGIGLATRNPEFESMDNLDSPRSRHSSRSFSSDASDLEINTAARVSEKEKPPKEWQVWMRRKMWGLVPYWVICMTVVVLALMVAVLGSVIGTFMAKRYSHARKDPSSNPNAQPSTTATYDATPIPTPSDLPPLPTGTFGIPPLTPNRASNTCFNDTTLSQAWNCYFVMASGMTLTVAKSPEKDGGEYTVALNCNHSVTLQNNVYAYGEQPPILSPVSMELVTDLLEPNRGPAWFRMLPYNKTVILPRHFLSPPGSPAPAGKVRGLKHLSPRLGEFKRKAAKPGDRPWICNWPQTWLEIFIYPQQNSSWFMGPPMPPPSSSTLTTETPAPTPQPQTQSSTSPSSTATPIEGMQDYRGTNGPQGPQGHIHPNRQAPPPPPPPPPTTPGAAPANPTGPFGPIDTGDSIAPGRPPVYPRVFKLEERRIAGAPPPDCTQWEIQEDGTAKLALDPDGKVIRIQIAENEPPPQESSSRSGDDIQRRSSWEYQDSPLLRRESGPDVSQCGCMWFLT